jgi:hypothetical protein
MNGGNPWAKVCGAQVNGGNPSAILPVAAIKRGATSRNNGRQRG